MEFEDMARKIVEQECEDYFLAMVDLSLVDNIEIEKYRSLISEYPRAISIGITLPHMSIDGPVDENSMAHNETSCKLSTITTHLSELLQHEGYKALSLPKAKINDGKSVSIHKLAASWANLGWIGKNGLLVTPDAGAGVNWGTVLTDAPL